MAKRGRGEPLSSEERRKLDRAGFRKVAGVFRFLLPYKGIFITGFIALIVSSVTLLAFPLLAGELLDVAQGKGKYFSSLNHGAIALLLILFFQGIFSFVRVYTFAIVSERGLADLRRAIYEKIIWLPMTFFDRRRVGELMSRMTADVSTLQDTFSFTLAEFFRQVITLVCGIGFLFYLAPQLTWFMLLTFPVLVVAALFFGKYIRKLSKRTQDTLAEANVVVEESLQSIFIVKAFTNEIFEVNRYSRALRDVVNLALLSARYRALFISFLIFAILGGIVAVGWYGATLVESGVISVGVLFSFVLYTSFIGFSIAGLGDIFTQLQRSIGASERVLEILEQQDELSNEPGPLKLDGAVMFNNVSFTYPTRPDFVVLNDLNFHINPGEKVALVGQSGSGKSTIINLLLRFYQIQQGMISVDGHDVNDYDLRNYRQNLGVVPQEVILFGGTIAENIRYGKPGATDEEVREAARKANALEFIDRFPEAFATVVGERGVKLSGGQRQRVAIARAILKDPAILILDEATSSLDAHSEHLVQQALETLMQGRTTIIIAHRLSTIKKVDRIFVIQQGRLAEVGSHAELTRRSDGIYANLLKMQLQES